MRNASPQVMPLPRRHRPLYQIVLYTSLLLLLGLVVMFALGPQRASQMNYAYGTSYSDTFFFQKQLISVVLAVVAFSFCAFLPYRFLTEKYAKHLFIIGLAMGALLIIFGAVLHFSFAAPTNGAYRWYNFGAFSFQPAELLKFGALVFIAGFLGTRYQQGKINDFQETLLPLAIMTAASLFVIVILQKDLGTGVSLMAIILSMMVVSEMDYKIIAKTVGILMIGGVLMILMAPHRIERVMTFIQGDSSKSQQDSNNYHIEQARIAIGSGGLFGLGIGKSVQGSGGYLPEAINDSIFAVLGETFGMVGLVCILGLFTMLLLSLLRVASRLVDMRLRLVVVGVFGWIGSHVLLNVAAMTGVAPLTGIPLPLLSYGGTNMMFIAAALGLAFQLSHFTTHKPVQEGGAHGKNPRSRRRVGRTRYASRRSM